MADLTFVHSLELVRFPVCCSFLGPAKAGVYSQSRTVNPNLDGVGPFSNRQMVSIHRHRSADASN